MGCPLNFCLMHDIDFLVPRPAFGFMFRFSFPVAISPAKMPPHINEHEDKTR